MNQYLQLSNAEQLADTLLNTAKDRIESLQLAQDVSFYHNSLDENDSAIDRTELINDGFNLHAAEHSDASSEHTLILDALNETVEVNSEELTLLERINIIAEDEGMAAALEQFENEINALFNQVMPSLDSLQENHNEMMSPSITLDVRA